MEVNTDFEKALYEAKSLIRMNADRCTVEACIVQCKLELKRMKYPADIADIASKFAFDCLSVRGDIVIMHTGKIWVALERTDR